MKLGDAVAVMAGAAAIDRVYAGGALVWEPSSGGGGGVAAGGDQVYDVGTDRVHVFTQDGTFTVSADILAEVLIVAGGGAGQIGSRTGGGGAGGLIHMTGHVIPVGNWPVTVGAGGAPSASDEGIRGGEASTFLGLVAVGGGRGGGNNGFGGLGGSGGGGTYGGGGGAGTSGQGYPGGGGYRGGAGGGAGGAGGTGSGGNLTGGLAVSVAITGTAVLYAGGGGGTTGDAGAPGGPNGTGVPNGNYGGDAVPTSYGSGGGAGAAGAGHGAPGVVIIRYPIP